MSDETKGAGEIGPYWISYYVADEIMPAFEYHGPWWVSGTTMDGRTIICAAVMASDEGAAAYVIESAFDPGTDLDLIEERFNNERAQDWSPFGSDRFRQADWMKWPWPTFAAVPPVPRAEN